MHTLSAVLAVTLAAAAPEDYFRIQVIDEQTGRGVPLIELATTNDIVCVTDSAGVVAFHEPALMGREVYFAVRGHGYEFPKDGFGFRGRRLKVEAGGRAELKVRRINIAERLYRVTGGGIYRDSVLLGEKPPTHEPLLNGQVFGCDSVANAVYRGRIYWFWGDTNRPSYPLGLFHVPGATSRLPADGGLSPSKGVNLEYFVGEDGFARPMCQMPGAGPTWIDGVTVVPGADGRERMFAHYVKVKPPLSVYQQGLVVYDDEQEKFIHSATWPEKTEVHPGGHPFSHTDGGKVYIYFAKPYPLTRVPATAEQFVDLANYETWTYFPANQPDAADPERDAAGKLVLGWKKNARPLEKKREDELIKQGQLKADERYFAIVDAKTGKPVVAHGGSVNWNAYRKKFVMLFIEIFGTSMLGEMWYAEADSPTGPWRKAVKIATHEKYDFYNPKQHPVFDEEGGRIVYFEGTYTNTFSGNPERTPRYNYNQIMYRLDLANPDLQAQLRD